MLVVQADSAVWGVGAGDHLILGRLLMWVGFMVGMFGALKWSIWLGLAVSCGLAFMWIVGSEREEADASSEEEHAVG